jgi:zinc transport system substrate-binding protein
MKWLLVSLSILLITFRLTYGQDVVATTSVLSSVIKDIGQKKIRVETLVAPGSCPGHFDLKVSHLANIEKSGILFAHGFETYLEKIKDAIQRPQFKPYIIEVEGNWLVPASQKEAYSKITTVLSMKFPRYKNFFERNRKKSEEEIDLTDRKIKKLTAEKGLQKMRVICNNHIKELIEYMGFDVAATYGRKEELTPLTIRKLVNISRLKDVRIVIDNLQAGPDTGLVVAQQLKVPHIAISNFPGVFPETSTLRETLYEDAKRIADVYEKSKNKTD